MAANYGTLVKPKPKPPSKTPHNAGGPTPLKRMPETAPMSRVTEVGESTPSSNGGASIGSIGGSASFVMFAGGALLVVAGWSKFVQPILSSGWSGSKLSVTAQDAQIFLGGIVFLIILVGLASAGGDAAGFATLLVIALWLVFLIMNGTGTLSTVFNFLGGGSTAGPGGSSGSTIHPLPAAPNIHSTGTSQGFV